MTHHFPQVQNTVYCGKTLEREFAWAQLKVGSGNTSENIKWGSPVKSNMLFYYLHYNPTTIPEPKYTYIKKEAGRNSQPNTMRFCKYFCGAYN